MTCAQYSSPAPMCACGNAITKFFKSGKPGKFCTACRDKQAGKHLIRERQFSCADCGAEVVHRVGCGPQNKYCSPRCKDRANGKEYVPLGEREFTCACCGATFKASHARKFCTKACPQRAYDQRRRPSLHPKQPAKHSRECKHCSKRFTYHPAGKDKGKELDRGLFCSSSCKTADRLASLPDPFTPIHSGYCLGCGAPFVSRRKRAFCSEACYPVKEYVSIAPETKSCTTCGASFAPPKAKSRPTDFCSNTCKDAGYAKHKRVARSRRRALTKTVTVESVDPFKVFERDKWRCQLCGVRTPKAKRGTYEPTAPELDHIITLAEGGEHSYRNTQCACRKCNGAKSSRSMGQLLMF